MIGIEREKWIDSISALNGAAGSIAAMIDSNEELVTGEQIYQLLKLIADHQRQLLDETES